MFMQIEPAELFMYRVKLIFDLERPNSEDQQVRDYLAEHGLEPKYRWNAEVEGSQCELMQFGGCYLGKYLDRIAQIQRHAVEVELLTAAIELHLNAPTPGAYFNTPLPISEAQRQSTIPLLVQEFHQDSSFKTAENGELVAALDGDAVREAAHRLLSGAPSACASSLDPSLRSS